MSKAVDDYAKLETYRDEGVVRTYDRRWSGARGARRDARKARAIHRAWELLERAAGVPLESALDVPCGTGRFTALLGEKARYLGADLSAPMVAATLERHPGASCVVADSASLPLATDAVDVAVCIRFLHLVRTPALRIAFVREMARVARYGVIVDYRHSHTLRIFSRHVRYRLGLRERAPSNPSPTTIGREVREAGLEEVGRIAVHRAPLLSDKVLIVARSQGAPSAR